MRENTATCGVGNPQYTFEHGGTIQHPLPAGYNRAPYYGGWPAVQPHSGIGDTRLLGYRHAQTEGTENQGQFSFTVTPHITYRVSLRTVGGWYLQALNGGGSSVNATGGAPGNWETFLIHDINGGSLISGEQVYVQTYTGAHYLQAHGGGGGVVMADPTAVGAWETFTIHKVNGSGIITTSDSIALRSISGCANGCYVAAEGGGGGAVNANRTSIGAWETFVLAPKPD